MRGERKVEYWGETGRDCFSRGGEHLAGCREKRDDNPMWKHISDTHDGLRGDEIFTMRMEKVFRKPLARQIREGVEIEMSEQILMNSKSEWNSARIPRIVIEEGERQIEDSESGLGKKGEEEKKSRQKERMADGRERNRNTKRVRAETELEVQNCSKRIRVEGEIIKKRQSIESERHRAGVKLKRDRERKERARVGIKGSEVSEGRAYWQSKFSIMAEK